MSKNKIDISDFTYSSYLLRAKFENNDGGMCCDTRVKDPRNILKIMEKLPLVFSMAKSE